MKRAFLVLALLVCPAPSRAQVDLAWSDTGPGAINTIRFDCDANEGADTLVASFRAPAGVTKLTALEAVVDFCTGQEDFPDWFDYSGCRAGALGASVDFTAGPLYFEDYWKGHGTAGIAFSRRDNNTGRIVVTASIPDEDAGPLTAGLIYYAFKVTIDHRNTTGGGACAGCATGACIVLNDLRLIGPGLDQRLNGPMFDNSPSWQDGVPGCPFIVPVESTTWTAIKTRHR